VLRASIEGVLVLVMAVFAQGAVKAAVLDFVHPARLEHVTGVGNLLALTAVLCLMYGSRFRPRAGALGAAADTARALAGTLTRAPGASALGIVLYHGAQIAAVCYMAGASLWPLGQPGAPPSAAWQCANATSLVYAPAYEEALFRVAIFYVLLKQAGGAVPFALLADAAIFAAIHVGNLFGAAAGGGTVAAYVWLQVAASVVCGLTYALLFVTTGSLWGPLAAHVANNAAALVWMGVQAPEGVKGAAACAPAVTPQLAIALLAQLLFYATVAWFLWRRLWAMIAPPPAQAPAPTQAAGSRGKGGSGAQGVRGCNDHNEVAATRAFRSLHPLVYGGDGNGSGAQSVASSETTVGAIEQPGRTR
jgi:membrane protease YdiL (CAAX protease family)